MKRYRLGLIHKFAKSNSEKIDGLRSALGGLGVGRVPPHITLVPPTNLHPRDAGAEIYRLRKVASETSPYSLAVGSAGTFHPVSPVLYLSVSGDGTVPMSALQQRLVSSDLYKPNTRPFIPHVTLLEPVGEMEVESGLRLFRSPLFDQQVSSFEMMLSPAQGYWEVSSDFRFTPLRRVHRGGMSIEVFSHFSGDLAVYELAEGEGVPSTLFWPQHDRRLRTGGQRHLVVSLYSEGRLIACAGATYHSTVALVRAVVVEHRVQRLGVGSLAVTELLYQLELADVENVFVVSPDTISPFFVACGAGPASVQSRLIGYESGTTLNSWSFSRR